MTAGRAIIGSIGMDAADLRVFEAVARLGVMNRAADELNTVQSNVTARIRALEHELGVTLFDRHSRGVTLTPAGRRLLPYAETVGRLIGDAARAVRDDGRPAGPLVIGSLETTAALRLSPLLTRYAATFPEVDLAIQTGTTAELVQSVLDHDVEGAFVCGPVSHPELEEAVVLREELVILTSPAVAGLDDLLNTGEVRIVGLRSGCSYRQRLEDLLARRGIVIPRQLEFGTLEAVVSCVAAGLGVTLLPKALIGTVWREGRVAVHALPAAEGRVETLFIRRRDAYRSSALVAFLDLGRQAQSFAEAAE